MTIKTTDIEKAISKRYSIDKGWCLAFEVADAPGFSGTGWCDAVAVGFWRQHNYKIHGFEFKVSRSDWMKELEQPHKAEKFIKHCNHWWIVAPKGVINLSELPDGWGFMRISANGSLKIVKDADRKPVSYEKDFLFAVMSRLGKTATSISDFKYEDAMAKMEGHLQDAKEMGYQLGKETAEAKYKNYDKVEQIEKTMDAIYGYGWQYNWKGPKSFVEDVKFAISIKRSLSSIKYSAEFIHQCVSEAITEIEDDDTPKENSGGQK